MKNYLTTILSLAAIVLLAALIFTKHSDSAQFDADNAAFADCSNRLDTAQSQLASANGSILNLSNTLAAANAAFAGCSNQLVSANASVFAQTEKIASLDAQIAAAKNEKDSLDAQIAALGAQLAGVSNTLAATQASLATTNSLLTQAYADYTKLENKFLLDVAERVVTERQFNNLEALKTQTAYLKLHPAEEITRDGIYAKLNVEVRSNGTVHVLSPE